MNKERANTKVLIIIPKYNFTTKVDYKYTFPLGLGYISAVLKDAGYNVDCLNLNHRQGYLKDIIANFLDKTRYDYVCTGGNSLIYAILDKILDTVRNHQSMPKTIIGGPIITSEQEIIFNALNPDFAVIGEGEKTVVELLDCLLNNGNLMEVKGIAFRAEGGMASFSVTREPIEDLDSISFPDYEGIEFSEQLDHSYVNDSLVHVFDNPRVYPLLASRGCPYKCTFCYHFERYRSRSIGNIMEELNVAVRRYRINYLSILDECLGIKQDRLYEVCEHLKKLNEALPWELKWSCQISVNVVDKEMLKTMKDSGCDFISYGFESYSPTVLKSMKKPIKNHQIDQALRDTLGVGLGVQANFIFGDVAETMETARETLDYWKDNCKGQVNVGFIQPYPGSKIYDHCIEKGIIKDKLDFIKNHLAYEKTINMTDGMTDEEFTQLKTDIYEAEGHYRKQVRPISMKKTRRDIYTIEVKCPFCEEITTYNNCYINNRWTYGFTLICRKCHMRSYIVSMIQKIGWAHHKKLKTLRIIQKKIVRSIKKKNQ